VGVWPFLPGLSFFIDKQSTSSPAPLFFSFISVPSNLIMAAEVFFSFWSPCIGHPRPSSPLPPPSHRPLSLTPSRTAEGGRTTRCYWVTRDRPTTTPTLHTWCNSSGGGGGGSGGGGGGGNNRHDQKKNKKTKFLRSSYFQQFMFIF
jgi:hypothetical protein